MKTGGPVRALGAMSGTSLDGVDAAVLDTDGHRILGFGRSAYRPYAEAERAILRWALGARAGSMEARAAAALVETAHSELLSDFPEAELVGFHGQTLDHAPEAGRTLQAGDGDILAGVLDRTVVWDFRSNDVAMGGQGAPLAPFFHHACARWIGAEAPLAFLNLGGVGNLTWVDPAAETPETPGALLAFDTGPANAPLDDLARARWGAPCDRDGARAAGGRVDEVAVERLLQDPYFARMPPKSLDRNHFSGFSAAAAALADADAAATLTAGAAAAVALGLEHCPALPARVLVTGGGRRNPVLMRMLGELLPCPVAPVEAAGLNGDMLEAQAFGFLAVRVLRGLPTSAPGTTGVAAPVGGGRVSHPEPGAATGQGPIRPRVVLNTPGISKP